MTEHQEDHCQQYPESYEEVYRNAPGVGDESNGLGIVLTKALHVRIDSALNPGPYEQ